MNVPPEVVDLLDEADRLPDGVTRRNLVAEAVRVADEAGDDDLGYELRGRLIRDATFSGGGEEALVAFVWCLARHEEDPVRFPADGLDFDLDWQFKWIVAGLPDLPTVSRERARAGLDAYRARVARSGVGQEAAAKLELRQAIDLGDVHLVEDLLKAWQRTPRDALSDCAACDVATVVDVHELLGRPAEVVGAAAPLLDGELECAEEPQRTFGDVMLAFHELGRVDEAAELHRRGYHLIRDNPSYLGALRGYLVDVSLRGQHPRALSMVERHLPWLLGEAAPVPWAVVALATGRAAQAGLAASQVRLPAGLLPEAPPTMAAAELAERAEARAAELAAAFDRRNGNDVVSRRVRKLLAMAPSTEVGEARAPVAPPPVPDVVPTGDEVADLLMRARLLLWSGRVDEGLGAAMEAAELADGADRPGVAAVARALCLRATASDHADDVAVLEDMARRLVAEAEASGDELAMAEVARSMAIVLGDEVLAERALSGWDRQPPWLRALTAQAAGAFAGEAGRLDEARTLFARGLAAAEESDVAALVLALLRNGAEAALDDEDRVTALELASRAVEMARSSGSVTDAGLAALLAADAAWTAGDEVAGIDHQRAAVGDLRAAAMDGAAAQAEAVLGSRLLDTGDVQEAADILESAADELAGLGAPLLAGRARHTLARARRAAGLPLQALASADEAAAALEGDDPGAAALALFEAALSLDAMDRDAEAADRFTRAAACFGRVEDLLAALDARRRAASSRGWAGDGAAARRELAVVVEEARARAEPWLAGAAFEDMARLLANLEEYDEAAQAAVDAVAAFDEAGDPGRAAWSMLLRGEILAAVESPEAATVLADAGARFEAAGDERGAAIAARVLDQG